MGEGRFKYPPPEQLAASLVAVLAFTNRPLPLAVDDILAARGDTLVELFVVLTDDEETLSSEMLSISELAENGVLGVAWVGLNRS